MVNLRTQLTELLAAGGIADAALEAGWILEDIPDAAKALETARRRAAHEPLQYLLGKWEFYGMPFYVGEGVLIPRADTETLVDAVLADVPDCAGQRIADLCTGSGCIAAALAKRMPQTQFFGLDMSPAALSYAEKNTALNHTDNVQLVCADVLDEKTAAQYSGLSAIVCNPPYLTAEDMANLQQEVTYEPASALDGGADGLHFYREITRIWKHSLRAGGLLAYEAGYTQAAQIGEILRENGFVQIRQICDLGGIARVVTGRTEN